MKKAWQVTIYNGSGAYRPISTILETDLTDTSIIKYDGIKKICIKKRWTKEDMVKYGYNKVKIRPYEPKTIAEINSVEYE